MTFLQTILLAGIVAFIVMPSADASPRRRAPAQTPPPPVVDDTIEPKPVISRK